MMEEDDATIRQRELPKEKLYRFPLIDYMSWAIHQEIVQPRRGITDRPHDGWVEYAIYWTKNHPDIVHD